MRSRYADYTVVITQVSTRHSVLWYTAYYKEDDDGDRCLPPQDTYHRAARAVQDIIDHIGVMV